MERSGPSPAEEDNGMQLIEDEVQILDEKSALVRILEAKYKTYMLQEPKQFLELLTQVDKSLYAKAQRLLQNETEHWKDLASRAFSKVSTTVLLNTPLHNDYTFSHTASKHYSNTADIHSNERNVYVSWRA